MTDENIGYPRVPGSKNPVLESQWNAQAPYGHCPACGSPGIEYHEEKGLESDLHEDGNIPFTCSDKKCRTKRSSKVTRAKHTIWYEHKPENLG